MKKRTKNIIIKITDSGQIPIKGKGKGDEKLNWEYNISECGHELAERPSHEVTRSRPAHVRWSWLALALAEPMSRPPPFGQHKVGGWREAGGGASLETNYNNARF